MATAALAAEADVAHCRTWPGAIPTALVPVGRVLCRLEISPAPGDLVCSVFIELNGAPQAVARGAQGSSNTGPGVCGPIIKLRWLFVVARVMSIRTKVTPWHTSSSRRVLRRETWMTSGSRACMLIAGGPLAAADVAVGRARSRARSRACHRG